MTSLIETEVSSIGSRLIQVLCPGAALMCGVAAAAYVWPGGAVHVRPGCGAWVTLCGAPWARATKNVKKPQSQMCESCRKA